MSGINSNEVFNDGNKYQVSKVNTFRKRNLGSRQRFDRSRGGNNNFYTTTRVVQDGVLPTGEIHYKREVIMFDSKSKLDDVPVEFRDFSSMTIAVDPEKLPEAKAVIREFRQKMASLLRDGNKTEVFQFALQLYPLTDMNSEGSHENIH